MKPLQVFKEEMTNTMNENAVEHNQNQHYLKRLYNNLALWIFLYLMIIVSGFYIIAVDFSLDPHQQKKTSIETHRQINN